MNFEEKREIVNSIIKICHEQEANAQLLVAALQTDAIYTLCELLMKEEISLAIKDTGSEIADVINKLRNNNR
jgi:hypothetical protein